jgi:23S rRNA pseudouridine1911/1915/1917 synthase
MRKRAPKGRSRASRQVAVLYEDDALVVLNKPPGLLATPIKGSRVPSAFTLLNAELETRRQRAFVVHRIDRFTSGILLFAKTEPDREVLIRQFLDHAPVREYLAVVRGYLRPPEGTLLHYLKREGMFQKLRKETDAGVARAELRYSVERTLPGASLVRISLVTGLQNQIRAQFAAIRHPVVGDRKYRPEEASEPGIDRVALHAAHLRFLHPRSGETISIDCPPPADFRNLVESLARPPRAR